MKKVILIVCLLALFLLESNAMSSYGHNRIYQVDLELPPLERWRPMVTEYKDTLYEFAYFFKNSMHTITQEEIEEFVTYGKYVPEFEENLNAISQLSGVDLPTLYTLNFMYDILHMGCTSVIIRRPNNSIFHTRNFDFNYREYFKKLLVQIQWKRDGEIVYETEQFIGAIVFYTFTKYGQYSLSINYRFPDNIQNSIDALLRLHYVESIFFAQQVIDQANTYDEAVELFKRVKISSSVFYIVSGLEGNQGIIIARERETVLSSYSLSDDVWFLVQVNYDRTDQDISDDMLYEASQRIVELGQENCTVDNILEKVMSVFPNKNEETVSTSIFSANERFFTIRNYLHSGDEEEEEQDEEEQEQKQQK